MSMKIYHGLKVKPHQTAAFFKQLGQLQQKIAKTYSLHELAHAALFDYLYNQKFFKTKKVTKSFAQHLDDRFVPLFDLNKQFSKLPYSNPYDLALQYYPEKQLILPLFENKDRFKELAALPSVMDYAYWNNTDPLEIVSKDQWKERETAWDSLPALLEIADKDDLQSHMTAPKPGLLITIFKEDFDEFNTAAYTRIHLEKLFAEIAESFKPKDPLLKADFDKDYPQLLETITDQL